MISLTPSWSKETVSTWVDNNPPRVYGPFPGFKRTEERAFATEEFPLPSLEELGKCDFKVADLSNGVSPVPSECNTLLSPSSPGTR